MRDLWCLLTFRVDQRDGFQSCGLQQMVQFTVGGMRGQKLHFPHHNVLHKDVVLAEKTKDVRKPLPRRFTVKKTSGDELPDVAKSQLRQVGQLLHLNDGVIERGLQTLGHHVG